jgi:hypothetical protein
MVNWLMAMADVLGWFHILNTNVVCMERLSSYILYYNKQKSQSLCIDVACGMEMTIGPLYHLVFMIFLEFCMFFKRMHQLPPVGFSKTASNQCSSMHCA